MKLLLVLRLFPQISPTKDVIAQSHAPLIYGGFNWNVHPAMIAISFFDFFFAGRRKFVNLQKRKNMGEWITAFFKPEPAVHSVDDALEIAKEKMPEEHPCYDAEDLEDRRTFDLDTFNAWICPTDWAEPFNDYEYWQVFFVENSSRMYRKDWEDVARFGVKVAQAYGAKDIWFAGEWMVQDLDSSIPGALQKAIAESSLDYPYSSGDQDELFIHLSTENPDYQRKE